MGVNLRICVACGTIKDNGWDNGNAYEAIIESRGTYGRLDEIIKNSYHPLQLDVCNDCLKKPIKEDTYLCAICGSMHPYSRMEYTIQEINSILETTTLVCWIRQIPFDQYDISDLSDSNGIIFDICYECDHKLDDLKAQTSVSEEAEVKI